MEDRIMFTLLASSLFFAIGGTTTEQFHSASPVHLHFDAARSEAVVSISELHLPAEAHYHHSGPDMTVQFTWPADGWVHGYRIDLVDSEGVTLPREYLHHAGVADLGRRQLTYPKPLRLFAVGQETAPVMLPESMGIRMTEGDAIVVYFALVNPGEQPIHDATLRITLAWSPAAARTPTEIFPLILNANPDPVGSSLFDLPPGRSVTSSEVVFPVGGRIRALGAHLHDHAVHIRLEDGVTGRVLSTLEASLDRDGHLQKIDTAYFQLTRGGLRVKANHPYRIVAVYNNPTGETIRQGAMAYMAGPFTPDDPSLWPKVEVGDPIYREEMARLSAPAAAASPERAHGNGRGHGNGRAHAGHHQGHLHR